MLRTSLCLTTICLAASLVGCTADSADSSSITLRKTDLGRKGETRRACMSEVSVTWTCGGAVIESSKDLSNIVFRNSNGNVWKNDGLSGHSYAIDDADLLTIWVKSGCNQTGDGPGYGERFDRPADLDCGGPECPDGYSDIDGECVAICDEGFEWDGAQCVDINPPTCEDLEPPVIECAFGTIVNLSEGSAPLTDADVVTSTSDDCDDDVELAFDPTTVGCNDLGTQQITVIGKDDLGYLTTCIAVISVEDPTNSCIEPQ